MNEEVMAFWDRALKEMRAVDPQVKLVKSAFQVPYAECSDLFFTGVGRARIRAKYLRPTKVAAPHPGHTACRRRSRPGNAKSSN
jgi:cephalosporin-C deacetylase